MNKSKLKGVYLVIDPSAEPTPLLNKTEQALAGGVNILQVWDHWPDEMDEGDRKKLIASILEIAQKYSVPVLANNEWKLLQTMPLDGVHFDHIPENFDHIKAAIGRDFWAGITCSNNLDIVDWADQNGMDYISFCALFPSSSVGSCEIVRPGTVKEARKRSSLPLFLSGGITPKNLESLHELDFNGVAVISGILGEPVPHQRAAAYKQAFNKMDSSK